MASLEFARPAYLFFLLLIPGIIFFHIVTLKMKRSVALKFANFEAIGRIKGIDFFSKNLTVLILSVLIVLLTSMALAGTIFNTELEAASHSFVIALDSSESMEADDLIPNRMEAAKKAASDFVAGAPIGTRFGVISFSGNSFIEQDVTNVKALVMGAIENVDISDVSGTDIYEAIITGTNVLKGEESKAIILLSDGQVNVGSIEAAVLYANENDVLVHTIALGSEEGGETRFGLSKVDEDSLQALAYNTEGNFFRALDALTLEESFRDAIKLTKRKVGINVSEYFQIGAIVLFGVMYFLINTRYRKVP